MAAAEQLGAQVGIQRACESLGVARASLYRQRRRAAQPPAEGPSRPSPPLKLAEAERRVVLEVLHSPRFVDASPQSVYATLLEEGRYLCSVRTMYRVLAQAGEVRERRNQLRHPAYAKPELLATAPNQLWSWDITKLKGPAKWTYFYLYVILDVFSRCVVGWMVATCESAALAEKLIRESCAKQAIPPRAADPARRPRLEHDLQGRGPAALGPRRNQDPQLSLREQRHPFSEAQFKTLKYRPDFPPSFGSLQDARIHCRAFFQWDNHEHRHSGIAYLTPQDLHSGRAEAALDARAQALAAAFEANPARFKGRRPEPQAPPQEVWINPPTKAADDRQEESA